MSEVNVRVNHSTTETAFGECCLGYWQIAFPRFSRITFATASFYCRPSYSRSSHSLVKTEIFLIRLYNYSALRIFRLHLKRGPILMIAGGAMVAISFSMLAYYGLQFVNSVQQEETLSLEPGASIVIQKNVNASAAAYVVAFSEFEGQAAIEIRDPSGNILIEKNIGPPIVIETFEIQEPGTYTLVLSNPTGTVLEASVLLDDYETVLSRSDLTTAMGALGFTLLLAAGTAIAIAGAVITFVDRRRINRMKQFGDTSDLV